MFFPSLQPLLQKTGDLHVTIASGPQGKLKVCVIPPKSAAKTASNSRPLMLIGTPEELEQGFQNAVQSYAHAHNSVTDQARATALAIENQAAAPKSTNKGGSAAHSDDHEDDSQEEDGTSPAAVKTIAEPQGTDLLSLIG